MKRLTKEQRKEIKKLRKFKGVEEIAKKFKVSTSTIEYHTSDRYKAGVKRRAREWFNALPEKRKKEIYKEHYESYGKAYMRDRYRNDPKFRARVRGFIEQNKKEKLKYARKNKLCMYCYKKLPKNFDKMSCDPCRKRRRIKKNEYNHTRNKRKR